MLRENVLSADNQQGRLSDSLKPHYVTGFVDGEGSFHIALYKDTKMKTGLKVIPEFHVSQRVSSRNVLDELVKFFASERSKPSSRIFLNGEQPYRWKLLHLPVKMSRHRGAELHRRYGRLGATSLLSPG